MTKLKSLLKETIKDPCFILCNLYGEPKSRIPIHNVDTVDSLLNHLKTLNYYHLRDYNWDLKEDDAYYCSEDNYTVFVGYQDIKGKSVTSMLEWATTRHNFKNIYVPLSDELIAYDLLSEGGLTLDCCGLYSTEEFNKFEEASSLFVEGYRKLLAGEVAIANPRIMTYNSDRQPVSDQFTLMHDVVDLHSLIKWIDANPMLEVITKRDQMTYIVYEVFENDRIVSKYISLANKSSDVSAEWFSFKPSSEIVKLAIEKDIVDPSDYNDWLLYNKEVRDPFISKLDSIYDAVVNKHTHALGGWMLEATSCFNEFYRELKVSLDGAAVMEIAWVRYCHPWQTFDEKVINLVEALGAYLK